MPNTKKKCVSNLKNKKQSRNVEIVGGVDAERRRLDSEEGESSGDPQD